MINTKKALWFTITFLACVGLSSCETNKPLSKPAIKTAPASSGSASKPTQVNPPEIKPKDTKTAELKIADYTTLKPASWNELAGIEQDNLGAAWPAWLQSCSALANKVTWKQVCRTAEMLNQKTANKPDSAAILDYFKQNFTVYQATNTDGTDQGTITGYYEPLLRGSRTKSAQYPYPIYATPADMLTVELDSIYPDLKYKRVRGRLVGNKVLPYYTRAEIEADASLMKAPVLLYVDDLMDVFFLQIQGSGLVQLNNVQLDNGEQVHVGYADQNGHPYNSIGRILIERGELTLATASMAGIKNWAKNNPTQVRDLLNSNPSYVFFRELPAGLPGPLGALGVPILAERAVAVDAKFIPLGAPVFLSTTEPNSATPLKRLMMAQDTGGAIKGGVRADFFWGAGDIAGAKAGAMKQTGKIWVLLPNANLP